MKKILIVAYFLFIIPRLSINLYLVHRGNVIERQVASYADSLHKYAHTNRALYVHYWKLYDNAWLEKEVCADKIESLSFISRKN